MTLRRLLLVGAVVFLACEAGPPPAPPPAPTPILPPEAVASGAEDPPAGGEAAADDDPTLGFVGFSGDETRLAYSAWSAGARTHLFTVVESLSGRRVTDFALDDTASRLRARTLLESEGYRGAPTPLRDGERLEADWSGTTLEVTLVLGQRRAALEVAEQFAGTAERLSGAEIALWGSSPSGRFAALRLVQERPPPLGPATSYVVVDLDRGRGRAP